MAWMGERDGAQGPEGNVISEEGWMPVASLVDSLRREPAAQELEINLALLQKLERTNSKARFVLRQMSSEGESDGEWYAAAWAGHTLPGVVGPGAVSTPPPILLHGTYRSKIPPIQLNGLLPLRRALHLQDPSCKSGRWRADLEVAVTVDTVRAVQEGCVFRLTGNGIWLTSQPIPTSAILSYAPWSAKVEAHAKGLWQGKLREASQGEGEGRFAPGRPEESEAGTGPSPRLDLQAYQGSRPAPKEADVDFGRSTSESGSDGAPAEATSELEDASSTVAPTYNGEWATPDGLKCLLCDAYLDGGHLMTPIHNSRMRWHLKQRAKRNETALATRLGDLTLETRQKAAAPERPGSSKGKKLRRR
ncbi:kptA [Symbiodinium sp. CCMP2592]|nr:kptA [Symbiodinium sp. CCMP2592]